MSVHIASNGHAKPASAADVLLGRPAHTPTPVSPPPAPPNSAPPPQMDEQVTPPKRRKLWIAFAPLAVAALGWLIWAGMPDGASARIDRADLAIAAVEQTVFQEYVATTAQAVPARTVYLDAVSGGRVEEVYVREGTRVEAGDPILKLSNDDVQLRLLSAEAQRVEQINRLQDTRFRLDQNALNLRQQLAEMDYQITRLGRERTRLKALLDKRLAPAKEFEAVDDEYQYFLSRRDLTLSAFQQDSLRTAGQIRSMQASLSRMEANQQVLQRILDNLVVRAPVAGFLTALEAEIGELRTAGARLGQIDQIDEFQLRAQVDEFYLSRINVGLEGQTLPIGGEVYPVAISKVYPEVNEGRFQVDARFPEAQPDDLRRGQSVRYRMSLSESEEAIVLPRGAFFQSTGGQWVFVMDEDGSSATRRAITLGRQNDDHFEVASGLAPGEQVIVSSYDAFRDAERLILQ